MYHLKETTKFENYTGRVRWGGTDITVTNSTFTLLYGDDTKDVKGFYTNMVFESGIVTEGYASNIMFMGGGFEGSLAYECIFNGAIFSGESFENGGWWKGKWESGEWIFGFDKFGRELRVPPTEWDNSKKMNKRVADEPMFYKDFTGEIDWYDIKCKVKNSDFEIFESSYESIHFFDGTVVSGSINNGIFDNCIFKGDSVYKSVWKGGSFYGKVFGRSSRFEGGDFHLGTFENSTFRKGIWHNGFWGENAEWLGGYDKYGKRHEHNDSPDKWND